MNRSRFYTLFVLACALFCVPYITDNAFLLISSCTIGWVIFYKLFTASRRGIWYYKD